MHRDEQTDVLSGVGCEVTTCLYHGPGNMCHADSIQVDEQTTNCNRETETFCGTFTAK